MYNKQFICTYNYYDSRLRKYNLTTQYDMEDVVDLEDVSEILYRAELMQVFFITDVDNVDWESSLKNKIVELFKLVSSHLELVECMKKTANLFLSEELDIGFMVLFSYDYFFLTHICICEFLESGSISEQNINALKNIISE